MTISRRKREQLIDKYGSNCFYCKRDPYEGSWYNTFQVDHIQPKSLGGSNDLSNLVPCCNRCNVLKGTQTLDEWEEYLEKRFKLIKRLLASIKEIKDGQKKND